MGTELTTWVRWAVGALGCGCAGLWVRWAVGALGCGSGWGVGWLVGW